MRSGTLPIRIVAEENRGYFVLASMKDVARKAGVSVSTVSRVISGKIPVDDKTKEKVQNVIKELDYKQNLLAMGLRIKSGRFIGLCVPEIADPVFARFISTIESIVVKNGYDLLLGNTRSNPEMEERFINHLLRRHVDGVIFSRVSDESRTLSLLKNEDIPVVVFDRTGLAENVLSVVIDNRKAGEMAANYFVKTGHKHIGCITGPMNVILCRERLCGFKEALGSSGVELNDRCIYEGNFKYESGKKGIDIILEKEHKLTAVWTQDDQMAIGVLKRLAEKGIKVPDDISVIGMDDIPVAKMIHPALSTIAQPYDQISEKAVDIILNPEKYTSIIHRQATFEPRLIVRDSTRNIN